MASRLLLLVIAAGIVALRCAEAWAPPPLCSTTNNYTDKSQYKKNLDQLLAALPAAAGDNGWFYEGSAGAAGADQVSGLIMCLADIKDATVCLDCLSSLAADITRLCPGSRRVDAMYTDCVLRYSDTPIPATADLAAYPLSIFIGNNAPFSSAAVQAAWVPLMGKLASTIAVSPLRIANDTFTYLSTQEMYGLAQCTKDLDGTECSRCINSYISQLHTYFFKPTNFTDVVSGVIKGYSCYLRYSLSQLDITLPPSPSPPPLLPPPLPPPRGPSSSSSSSKTGIVIGVSVGSISFLTALGIFTCLLLRRRGIKAKILDEVRKMEDEFEEGAGPKRFRYNELAMATYNFSDAHKLGEGGFGSVYRGFLKEMNTHVSIKRVSKGSKQGRKEFASEVKIISRLRHRNLVQLISWCHDGGELFLVYELTLL